MKSQRVNVSGDADLIARPTQPAPASVSDRFGVQELLGEGGMGAVYTAQDKGLGRVVAIKQLRPEFVGDRGALRRFVLEAQIGAQLEHPNIVPLYSLERTPDGSPAIAMQLLAGRTMAQYIADAAVAPSDQRLPQGPYALKERLVTLLGVCDAVQFAHERGVVHRDLKPDNVMLGDHREVYVMDWGLARVQGSVGDTLGLDAQPPVAAPAPIEGSAAFDIAATLVPQGPKVSSPERDDALATRHGQILGTPQYMPPEQAQGRVEDVGFAADQYALGVMLLELAILKPARSYTSLQQALVQASDGWLDLSDDVDDRPIPLPLLAIIQKSTQHTVGARYPSVKALADDVRRFIKDEPVSVYPEGPARRLVRVAAKRPAMATGLVAGVILLAAGALIASLAHSARQAEHRAYDLEGSRKVLIAVSGRAHAIDVRLSDLAAAVEAIAAAASQSLSLDGGDTVPAAALGPLPPLVPQAALSGVPVSYAQPVISWVGRATGAAATPSVGPLWRLEPWLRRAVDSGLSPADHALDPEGRTAALLEGRGILLRGFVGLEDGTFVQVPAKELPADHDPRDRPWYRDAKKNTALHWTRPVVDVAGKSVRLTAVVPLRDARGNFAGAAGTDLKVTVLAKELALDLPGFRKAYLVTEDGKVAVSEDLRDRLLTQHLGLDEAPELPAVEEPLLAQRLATGSEGGYVETGDGRLLVYARLISPPWTYVAELDAAPYLSK